MHITDQSQYYAIKQYWIIKTILQMIKRWKIWVYKTNQQIS